jgi:gluconokinase
MLIVVMGVSGAGKTHVGEHLAAALGWPFLEGDEFHSAANIARMHQGVALTDADRHPWLLAIHGAMARLASRRESAIIACSALTARYRTTLRGDLRGVRFVYLKVDRDVLAARLANRTGHFFDPALLDSQLATLEEPQTPDAITVDGTAPVGAIIADVRRELRI